jgi:hypothetical protein
MLLVPRERERRQAVAVFSPAHECTIYLPHRMNMLAGALIRCYDGMRPVLFLIFF